MSAVRLHAGPPTGKLSMWNMRAFKKVHTFSVQGDPVLDSLAFSADGTRMLAAGNDGLVRIFDASLKSEVCHPRFLMQRFSCTLAYYRSFFII
jgi:WD40 repeat protein